MTFLQVGSCGSALLHGTFVGGNVHGSFVDLFAFRTHTIFVFFGAWGCGMATCEGVAMAAFFCKGTHI